MSPRISWRLQNGRRPVIRRSVCTKWRWPRCCQTRLLVTHGINLLPDVDQIVVLVEGRVSEVGSYQELLRREGAFAHFLKNYLLDILVEEEQDEVFELDAESESRPRGPVPPRAPHTLQTPHSPMPPRPSAPCPHGPAPTRPCTPTAPRSHGPAPPCPHAPPHSRHPTAPRHHTLIPQTPHGAVPPYPDTTPLCPDTPHTDTLTSNT